MDSNEVNLQLPPPVAIPFPVGGLNTSFARAEQPPRTTVDALNVMPYDLSGRARGGPRPGVTQVGTLDYGSGITDVRVQALLAFAATTTGGAGVARRDYLLAIVSGHAYYATALGDLTDLGTPGGGFTIGTTSRVCLALLDNKVFVTDGNSTIGGAIDFSTGTPAWGGWGTPVGTPPTAGYPKIVAVHQKRLLLSRTRTDPQNVYASRIDAPGDWNVTANDPAGAWELNKAVGGGVGDPVTLLASLSDDALFIGCDRSCWLLRGNVNAGGRVDCLSHSVGALDHFAQAFDPDGNLYFLGTGGLYRVSRGTYQVQNLTQMGDDAYFRSLTAAGHVLSLLWDRTRHGLWIFNTSDPQAAQVHQFYDARSGGTWPQQIAQVFGPTAVTTWAADGQDVLVFGGWSWGGETTGSRLYEFDAANPSDDGLPFIAYVYLGPVRPSGNPAQQYKLTAVDVTLGEPFNVVPANQVCALSVQSGNSPYEAWNSPRRTTAVNLSGSGRQPQFRTRHSATDYMIKISSSGSESQSWSFEEVVCRFLPAGRARS